MGLVGFFASIANRLAPAIMFSKSLSRGILFIDDGTSAVAVQDEIGLEHLVVGALQSHSLIDLASLGIIGVHVEAQTTDIVTRFAQSLNVVE